MIPTGGTRRQSNICPASRTPKFIPSLGQFRRYSRAPAPRLGGCRALRPRLRPGRTALSTSVRDYDTGDDRRRPVGVQAPDLPPLLEGHRGEPLEDLLALLAPEHVARRPVGVVGIELLGDRRQRGRGAGDADRALYRPAMPARAPPSARIWRTSSSASSCSPAGGRRGDGARSGARRRPGSRRGSRPRGRPRSPSRSSRRRCRHQVGAGRGSRSLRRAQEVSRASSSPVRHVRLEPVALVRPSARTPARWPRRAPRSSAPRPSARRGGRSIGSR